MELSVIIVSHNAKYFTEHCLFSVIKACRGIEAEILLFDNNSTDGSKEYLASKFPQVQFIWNGDNIGFAKANNRAMRKASGRHILFLNPDTVIGEDCLSRCLEFFKTHSDCGAVGVKMVDGRGQFLPESKRMVPGAKAGLYKMSGLSKMSAHAKKHSGYYADHINENDTAPTEVLAGAFMMLSCAAIEMTGGFDEDFFMYGEDIDLSYRIKMAGLNNYYFGGTAIIHFKGESTQKISATYYKHFYGAMKRFADKHYGKNPFRDLVIAGGKNIALLRAKLNPGKSRPPGNNGPTLIAGNAQEPIPTTLVQNNFKVIGLAEELTTWEQILRAIEETAPGNIIFCEGVLTNKDIITTLQKLPGKMSAFFHESGAESIIGSPDRNRQGIAISMTAMHL